MIKIAKKKNGKDIAKLLATFGKEIFDLTGAKINTDIELIIKLFNENLEKDFRAFVYEINNQIVGFITFNNSFSLYAQGHFFTITELYVEKKYRCKNIGKKLLDRVIKLAKDENRTRLELTTPPLPEFQRSLNFYLKNGFDVTGGKKVKYDINIK